MTLNPRLRRPLTLIAVIIIALVFGLAAEPALVGKAVQIVLIAFGFLALMGLCLPWVARRVETIAINFRRLPTKDKVILLYGMRRLAVLCVLFLVVTRLIGHFIVIPRLNTPVEERLAQGLVYGREVWQGSEVNWLAVDLEKVKPEILSAPSLAFGQRSLAELAKQSPRIVAAVNGDFFDEGGPIGFLVPRRRLTAPNRDRASLTFNGSGTQASIELYRFATTARVIANGSPCPIRQTYNNAYTAGDVGVYTPSRGVASGAGSTGPVIQARVQLTRGQDGDIRLAGIVTESIKTPRVNMQPQAGEIIVVAGNEPTVPTDLGAYDWARKNLFVSAPIEVDLSASPKPAPLVISGGPEFLRFGQYFAREKGNENIVPIETARTAIGISGDGQFLMVVVVEGPPKLGSVSFREMARQLLKLKFGGLATSGYDNAKLALRAGWQHLFASALGLTRLSKGMTMQDLAKYMSAKTVFDQPIVSAINLDGGSSSAMVVAKDNQLQCVCTPMEGRQVQLATALGFAPRP